MITVPLSKEEIQALLTVIEQLPMNEVLGNGALFTAFMKLEQINTAQNETA